MIKYNDYASILKFKSFHFVGLMSQDMIEKNQQKESLTDLKISENIFIIPSNSILQNYINDIKLNKILFGPLAETDDGQLGFIMDFKGD